MHLKSNHWDYCPLRVDGAKNAKRADGDDGWMFIMHENIYPDPLQRDPHEPSQ